MADPTKPAFDLSLATEIATTRDGRDITQPYVRGLREAKDPKLSTAVDWGAYDVVFNDDQVFSTMQQRIGSVVSRNWSVIAGDENDPRSVKAAKLFDENLKRLPWDKITRKMLMAVFYGYAVAEIMWEVRDGLFAFKTIKVRHARRFRYDDEDNLRMLLPGNMMGEIMPEKKFWVHAVGAADDDQPYGLGLAHWLYWPTLFKRNGIRFWNIFLDKFGTPTAKGTYPRGTSEGDINKLLAALQAMATDSGFVIPDGMAVELLSTAKSGTADFHQLCTYMDSAISKVVLSQTMTTDNGSSRAQGQVHAGVKMEVTRTDADDLTDSYTSGPGGEGGPARWWTDFNFGTDVAAPIVRRLVEEEEDTKTTAETDQLLSTTGWVRTEDSFRDTYGEGFERAAPPPASAVIPPTGQQPADPAAKDAPVAPVPVSTRTPADVTASFAADDPRPLYVYRPLLNTSDLLEWAHQQGFTSALDAADLHVTVMYSRRPVNWFAMGEWGPTDAELVVPAGGPRVVEPMGTAGAVALIFGSGELQFRHRQMRDAGASWDYPSYLPHITITYAAPDGFDLAKVQPYQGRLVFGPERFEAIQSNWQGDLEETPTTASFAEGGAPDHDDTDGVVDRMITEDGYRVADAMTGTLLDRIMGATSEAEARALIASALGLMDEQPLMQALERAGFAAQLNAASQPAPTETDA